MSLAWQAVIIATEPLWAALFGVVPLGNGLTPIILTLSLTLKLTQARP